jgi:hypothetical protein
MSRDFDHEIPKPQGKLKFRTHDTCALAGGPIVPKA